MTTVREWKPGDVVVSMGDRLIRTKDGTWSSENGQWGIRYTAQNPRPLVVVDPEDREQVEQLTNALLSKVNDSVLPFGLDLAQAALREFANPKPPKPEEPTGLGAVVEDIHGRRYQRVERDRSAWLRSDIAPDAALDWRDYDEINAVKVLSEGIPA